MQSNSMASRGSDAANVQEVNASSGGLAFATLSAAVVAGAILTFVWLPAEHGIDPTGVGHLLGLDEMGHIKEQLHVEAEEDAAASAAANVEGGASDSATQNTAATQANAANANTAQITQQLNDMQAQLNTIAAAVGVSASVTTDETATQSVQSASQQQTDQSAASDTVATAWRDEVSYTLEPTKGIEVKLIMNEGDIAQFEWSANGSVLNHDTHGHAKGQNISYEKGRGVADEAGEITAAFKGFHGWFWRNRTDAPVTVTLKTKGVYKGLVLP